MTTPATSLAAFASLSIGPLKEKIFNFIESAGERGVISDDVFKYLKSEGGKNDSSVTTRFSELERAGLIYRAGDTRTGDSGRQQMVMRSIEHIAAHPAVVSKEPAKSKVFMKGAYWGLRRAAKVLMTNSAIKGTPEFIEILKEIKEMREPKL